MNVFERHIGLFISGIVAGIGALSIQLIIFVGDVIMEALKNISVPVSASQIITTYTSAILIFTILGVIINILVGYFGPISFSFGFLLGDFLMIAFLSPILNEIAPLALNGMIVAFVALFIGLLLKFVFKDTSERYKKFDVWG